MRDKCIEAGARAFATASGDDPDDTVGFKQHPLWREYIPEATAAFDAMIEKLMEPDEEMLEAAAETPGVKAADQAMTMYQVRGCEFDPAAFEGGSVIQQTIRAALSTLREGDPK